MDPTIKLLLDQADHSLRKLESKAAGNSGSPADGADRVDGLICEIMRRLRTSLNLALREAWMRHISARLSETNRWRAKVHFPIGEDLNSFHSILRRAFMGNLKRVHQPLYEFLLATQPFSSTQNLWLSQLDKIVAGKDYRSALRDSFGLAVTSVGGIEVAGAVLCKKACDRTRILVEEIAKIV